MTFEQAAALDSHEMPGELNAGRWVPTTQCAPRHGRIVLNVSFQRRL
jgi:hypothetical protein